MYKFKVLYLSLAALLLFSCDTNKQSGNAELSNITKEVIDNLVIKNEVPGISFSIIYKDCRQANYSSGMADLENKTKLNTDHVIFSGSIGKTYAVAILMQLVDDGKINLGDKIISYFPEITWLNKLPNINDITVEMLLQHTSGLPRYVMKPEIYDTLFSNPDKIWSYEDRLSVIFNDTAVHEAEKGWAYSDTNYILLGMLIEKVTGNNYYDEVKTRLLIPYKLTATHPSIKRDIPNLPSGYSRLPEMFQMPEKVVEDGLYVFNPQMEWTGGGMASTTSDLAKWARIYYHSDLIPSSLKLKMTTPSSKGENIGEKLSYGMGSFIYDTKAGKAYGHTGFVPGFVSIFAFYPDQQISVALQVNCDYATQKMTLVDYLDNIMSTIIN